MASPGTRSRNCCCNARSTAACPPPMRLTTWRRKSSPRWTPTGRYLGHKYHHEGTKVTKEHEEGQRLRRGREYKREVVAVSFGEPVTFNMNSNLFPSCAWFSSCSFVSFVPSW